METKYRPNTNSLTKQHPPRLVYRLGLPVLSPVTLLLLNTLVINATL